MINYLNNNSLTNKIIELTILALDDDLSEPSASISDYNGSFT